MIKNYDDFITELFNVGFSTSGGKDEGIFALIPWGWTEDPPYETPIKWKTGDKDTDPWEWRIRVLEERNDIAYAKFFTRRGGYITREWYKYFLAARRGGRTFEDAKREGLLSDAACRIYEVLRQHGRVPATEIKKLGTFYRKEGKIFIDAMSELQMGLYITMCGERFHRSLPTMIFCTVEEFFPQSLIDEGLQIPPQEAYDILRAQILKVNPNALERKIRKFITGVMFNV